MKTPKPINQKLKSQNAKTQNLKHRTYLTQNNFFLQKAETKILKLEKPKNQKPQNSNSKIQKPNHLLTYKPKTHNSKA